MVSRASLFLIVLSVQLISFQNAAYASGSNATTIGKCEFFQGRHVTCVGRLRCRPSDFLTVGTNSVSANELPELNLVCPGLDETGTGAYTDEQGIIPAEFIPADNIGANFVIATCVFRTNGTFFCHAGIRYPDAFWSGVFSGSLNAAFKLGLDTNYFHQDTQPLIHPTAPRTELPPTTSRPGLSDDDYHIPNTFMTTEDERITSVNDVQQNQLERNSPLRPPAVRDEDPRAAVDDEHEYSYYTIPPRRVFICEYYSNGFVSCRNCTERISNIVLESGETGNRRDYNCSQSKSGPYLKRWTAGNGIIPAVPDLNAPERQVIATCIFEKSVRTYECHGESKKCQNEPVLGLLPRNRCLTGKRWTGDYDGTLDVL